MTARRLLTATTAALGLALVPAQAQAIVGGTDAAKGAYPSTAKITIASAFGCTGTLIAPQWVITAGHCSSLTGGGGVATPIRFPALAFEVTVDGVKADGSDGESVTVDQVEGPLDYLGVQGYDITLLHLSAKAKATPTPIAGKGYEALWNPNVTPSVLTEIVGFGTTSSGGDAPETLKKAKVPFVTDAACEAVYGGASATSPLGGFEAATQICAGYDEGGVDSCQGDSGGPMYARNGEGRLFLVGATSYGNGCADPKTPGVYARVSDGTLREYIRGLAPEAILDAVPGAVTTPAELYDPATKTVVPGPAATPATTPETAAPTTGTTTTPVATSTPVGTAPASATPAASTPGSAAPSSVTTTSVVSGARFSASLAVDRTLRRTVRAKGLRTRVRCSAACSAALRLELDAATAKKLGLSNRTVGGTTLVQGAAGRSTKAVKLSKALAARIVAAKGAMLMVVATVKEKGAAAGSTLSAKAVLAGK